MRHLSALLAVSLAALLSPSPGHAADSAPARPAKPAPARAESRDETPAETLAKARASLRRSDEAMPLSPAVAQAQYWRLALKPPAKAKKAAPAVATVRLTALSGGRVDLAYQPTFKPDATSTVKFASGMVDLAPGERVPCVGVAEETCEVALALPFTMGRRPAALSGTVAFRVCGADGCHLHKVRLGATMP